ncbi:hypothetical protein K1719_024646 [Acacia pycnantha]|nr:hypothetical protein K1719_024646 [Acacia pycnantha]
MFTLNGLVSGDDKDVDILEPHWTLLEFSPILLLDLVCMIWFAKDSIYEHFNLYELNRLCGDSMSSVDD